MNGTRTARLTALAAATTVAIAVVVAAVLATGDRTADREALRAPAVSRTASDHGAPAAPRTTPPPTFPLSGGVGVGDRSPGTLAATTVDHS